MAMNIEEILNSGIINISKLARDIYPVPADKATSEEAIKKYNIASQVRLQQKIKRQNKQRLTETDLEAIEKYLKNIFK